MRGDGMKPFYIGSHPANIDRREDRRPQGSSNTTSFISSEDVRVANDRVFAGCSLRSLSSAVPTWNGCGNHV
jgi:hypothetical protein